MEKIEFLDESWIFFLVGPASWLGVPVSLSVARDAAFFAGQFAEQ
jgi:hypothetical protein